MISVCIPIYNSYAYPLARRLYNQAAKQGLDVEIVCIDNNSSAFYANQNKGLVEVSTYVRLKEKIGTARLKNLFLKYAKGEYLLLLESDMQPDENYLKNYERLLAKNPQVVVGGELAPEGGKKNAGEYRLHTMYSSQREWLAAKERTRRPYYCFSSNNCLINREVFSKVTFSTIGDKQGNEDYLFAYRLMQARVPVLHVDNGVRRERLYENAEFLHNLVEKTQNQVAIYDSMWEDQTFCTMVPVLSRYTRLRRLGLIGLYYRCFKLVKNISESHFVNGTGVSIRQLKFYCLGVFLEELKK